MREKVLNALENCKKPVYPGQEPKPLTFPLTFEKINPTWGTPETYLKLAREIEKAHGIKEQT